MKRRRYGATRKSSKSTGSCVVISNREFITNIVSGDDYGGSSGFATDVFAINPGMAETFPWLSSVAGNFETYTFKRLRFYFVSTSGDIASNTALGNVCQTVQYNSAATPFENMKRQMNYEGSVVTVISGSSGLYVKTSGGSVPNRRLWVRDTPIELGRDPRLFDMGLLQVSSEGAPVFGVILGQLWVEYQICLYTPKLDDTPANGFTHFEGQYILSTPSNIVDAAWQQAITPLSAEAFWDSDLNLSMLRNDIGCSFAPYFGALPGQLFASDGNPIYSGMLYFLSPLYAGRVLRVDMQLTCDVASNDFWVVPPNFQPVGCTWFKMNMRRLPLYPWNATGGISDNIQSQCRSIAVDCQGATGGGGTQPHPYNGPTGWHVTFFVKLPDLGSPVFNAVATYSGLPCSASTYRNGYIYLQPIGNQMEYAANSFIASLQVQALPTEYF